MNRWVAGLVLGGAALATMFFQVFAAMLMGGAGHGTAFLGKALFWPRWEVFFGLPVVSILGALVYRPWHVWVVGLLMVAAISPPFVFAFTHGKELDGFLSMLNRYALLVVIFFCQLATLGAFAAVAIYTMQSVVRRSNFGSSAGGK